MRKKTIIASEKKRTRYTRYIACIVARTLKIICAVPAEETIALHAFRCVPCVACARGFCSSLFFVFCFFRRLFWGGVKKRFPVFGDKLTLNTPRFWGQISSNFKFRVNLSPKTGVNSNFRVDLFPKTGVNSTFRVKLSPNRKLTLILVI